MSRARCSASQARRPASSRALRAAAALADSVRTDTPAARALREALELVGGLVDCLQVALVFELSSRRRKVGMPALGHPPARELDVPLVERGIELEQQQVALDVKDTVGIRDLP